MAYIAPSVTNKQCGNTVPVELFITTATASLPVKKDQQSLIFLLDTKKVKYECFDVASDEAKRMEMHQRSNERKLPQLFINGQFIGVRFRLSLHLFYTHFFRPPR
jgi:glutaredoxin